MNGKLFFPHANLRDVQDELISSIMDAIASKKSIIAHAPTGLGKTAAAIAPALTYAMEHDNITVFFLTSRHTQHRIAVDTVKDIKQKFNLKFSATDIIGKKWMCPVPGAELLRSSEFTDYCKAQREEEKCEFFSNTKKKNNSLSAEAKILLKEIENDSPVHVESVVSICKEKKLCPYELSLNLASKSKVIIADYYYIFHPKIREPLFLRMNKELKDCLVIVDEGHNLPSRIRELMTSVLSTFIINRAVKEAKKFGFNEYADAVNFLGRVLESFASKSKEGEMLIEKQEFVDKVKESYEYEQLYSDLESAGDEIRERQKQSYVGSISAFLESWLGEDKGYARILSVAPGGAKPFITLSYRCLDPSIATADVLKETHSTIMMSGTLNPVEMYKDLLGFPDSTMLKTFKSPFPKKNQLSLVVPLTTTKYSERSENEFMMIGKTVAEIVNLIPGNVAVFFPSYGLRDRVYVHMSDLVAKKFFLEASSMTKKDKTEMLDKFKSYKDKGAVLLGVAAANFAEGIDLPGDLLNGVVVVGLPLQRPDLETKKLIEYYDSKFGKGWDYGYLYPGFNKALQSAGRCIRSETDKGVIVFLDKRYSWPNYMRCFPLDMKLVQTVNYKEEIEEFFGINKE